MKSPKGVEIVVRFSSDFQTVEATIADAESTLKKGAWYEIRMTTRKRKAAYYWYWYKEIEEKRMWRAKNQHLRHLTKGVYLIERRKVGEKYEG